MPIGCASLIPYIAQDLIVRRPSSVLDLGIGNGLYGAVVRNYCGDLDPGATRHTRLIGVEGWAAYRGRMWDLYDHVAVCSIESYLAATRDVWDVILLMDVIEHFPKDVGAMLLTLLQTRVAPGGVLWVGTPAAWFPQTAVYGNDLECHRSLWNPDDFRQSGFTLLQDDKPDAHGNQMLLARFTP